MDRVNSQHHGLYYVNIPDEFMLPESSIDYGVNIKRLSNQDKVDNSTIQNQTNHNHNEQIQNDTKMDESILNILNQHKKSSSNRFGSTKSFRTFENQNKKTQKTKGSNINSSIINSQVRQLSQNDQLKESLQFRVLIPSRNPYCKFSEFQNNLNCISNEAWFKNRLSVLDFNDLIFYYVPNLDVNVPCYVTYNLSTNKNSDRSLNIMAFNPLTSHMLSCFSDLNKQAFFEKIRSGKKEFNDTTAKVIILPQIPTPYNSDDSITKCFFIGITKD